MSMVNGIAERLREERTRLGLTQTQLGVHGGVKKLAQMNYENSKRIPDVLYLARIHEAGADVLYIITGRRSA